MSAKVTKWWTREQLAFARRHEPEAGAFREDQDSTGHAGGAYGCNLSEAERRVLEGVDWERVEAR